MFSPKLTNASFVLVCKFLSQVSSPSTPAHQTPSVLAPCHGQPQPQGCSQHLLGAPVTSAHIALFPGAHGDSSSWKRPSGSFLSCGSWERGFENWRIGVVWSLLSHLKDSLSIQNSRLAVVFLPDSNASWLPWSPGESPVASAQAILSDPWFSPWTPLGLSTPLCPGATQPGHTCPRL